MSPHGSYKCKNLLIFGATGLIGSHIIRAILSHKADFGRIAVFTSQNTVKNKKEIVQQLQKDDVEILVGDLTNSDDISRAYHGIDTVISCVGRNMIEQQIELIRLANLSPSVRRFFPSEYGTDIEYHPQSAFEKPHQKKLKVRAAIKACDNLDYTFLVTGPYADGDPGLYLSPNSTAQEVGCFDVSKKKAVLVGDGSLRISFTTMRDVGKLLGLALLHSDATKNRALRVNSFTATDLEILNEFEKQTGPWTDISYISLEELKSLETKAWKEGMPLATLVTLRRIWSEGGTLYAQRDNQLIEGENVVDSLSDAVSMAIEMQKTGPTEMTRQLV